MPGEISIVRIGDLELRRIVDVTNNMSNRVSVWVVNAWNSLSTHTLTTVSLETSKKTSEA